MEENKTPLDSRISELRSRLNKMEMLSELDKTDIKNAAMKMYFDTLIQGIGKEVSEAVDRYLEDPAVRLEVANTILDSVGLDAINCGTSEEILDSYMSRF